MSESQLSNNFHVLCQRGGEDIRRDKSQKSCLIKNKVTINWISHSVDYDACCWEILGHVDLGHFGYEAAAGYSLEQDWDWFVQKFQLFWNHFKLGNLKMKMLKFINSKYWLQKGKFSNVVSISGVFVLVNKKYKISQLGNLNLSPYGLKLSPFSIIKIVNPCHPWIISSLVFCHHVTCSLFNKQKIFWDLFQVTETFAT